MLAFSDYAVRTFHISCHTKLCMRNFDLIKEKKRGKFLMLQFFIREACINLLTSHNFVLPSCEISVLVPLFISENLIMFPLLLRYLVS